MTKKNLLRSVLLIVLVFTFNSCSSDASEVATVAAKSQNSVKYTYSTNELETMKLINNYRKSIGLST
jgi:hypothetical protein